MGFNGMHFSGFWIIPMIFCFAMMAFMLLRGRGPFSMRMDHNNTSNYERRNSNSDSALEILNQRYAKGEISQQEYTEMKANLVR